MVDVAAARVGADEQRWSAESVPEPVHLRWPHVVVPAAPVVVRPHERRALPVLALDKSVHDRPHEPFTGLNAARWVLTRSRRSHVGDLGQRAARQVAVILAHIDDVREELRVVEIAGVVEWRHPDDLRAAVRRNAATEGDSGVVVLDVELPRDAGFLQPVEDHRQLSETGARYLVKLSVPRRAANPEHVVPHAAAGG